MTDLPHGYYPGADGFGEQDPPLALGTVSGVRVFDFHLPADAVGQHRPPRPWGTLSGLVGVPWADGENAALCQDHAGRPSPHVEAGEPPPGKACGCGFWAYWARRDAHRHFSPRRPVLAVVDGYGRTRIGRLGFRAGRARIAALNVAFGMTADPDMDQASLALAEERLAELYPSARIYATCRAMLARHPLTTGYGAADDDPPAPSRPVTNLAALSAMQSAMQAELAEMADRTGRAAGLVTALMAEMSAVQRCPHCGALADDGPVCRACRPRLCGACQMRIASGPGSTCAACARRWSTSLEAAFNSPIASRRRGGIPWTGRIYTS